MERELFERLLIARGLRTGADRETFVSPSYHATSHDPYLLPDMLPAVERLVAAKKQDELVYIYGDYDIDGLTATTILLEAFRAFGLRTESFIPNRFVDGYGLSKHAIEELAKRGANLIVTVDCGSLSHAEIELANSLGVDVIVTDHHNVAEIMPPAVATINPKRPNHNYPFIDLAGCGVAFKLVQALQQRLAGLPKGQEKWLLDLVALGTVCDVVNLQGENRTNVYWGLQVMAKTRRIGLKALAAVAGVDVKHITARQLGFVIGPHLNAAGRLETAQLSLELLRATDGLQALEIAKQLHEMNKARRAEQDRITREAVELAAAYADDPVLVLSNPGWSHGIIGIVAAKLLEQFQKPAFVLQELEDGTSKGSARSYGDFSAADGIRASEQWIIKGGGHKLAAGVTLATENIQHFRQAINDFYRSLQLADQLQHLKPVADLEAEHIAAFTAELLALLQTLEPYGHGNPEPVFCVRGLTVRDRRLMGADKQHLKLQVIDQIGNTIALVGFNMAAKVDAQPGDIVDAWIQLIENEWRGNRSIEGRLLDII